MINHGRTLLMNVDGHTYVPDGVGEEYIPATYKETTLPAWLQRVRGVVFGQRPSRDVLKYRTRELLQLIHATELSSYLLDLDPRITYEFKEYEGALDIQDTIPTLSMVMGASRAMGEDNILRLFGPANTIAGTEPYGTFYRLWRNHHELPYGIGGLALALIYRTEEARHV